MSVRAVQNKDSLATGDQWVIDVIVRDLDGCRTDAVTPVVTVTLPDTTTATPTVERLGVGTYRVAYTVAAQGRHVGMVAAAGYGTAAVAVQVADIAGPPELAAVLTYLDGEYSDDEDAVSDALAAEAGAQRAVCRIPASYPADLRQALLRRVMVNLSRRRKPALSGPGTDGQNSYLPINDQEVRRLERPYRKVVLA